MNPNISESHDEYLQNPGQNTKFRMNTTVEQKFPDKLIMNVNVLKMTMMFHNAHATQALNRIYIAPVVQYYRNSSVEKSHQIHIILKLNGMVAILLGLASTSSFIISYYLKEKAKHIIHYNKIHLLIQFESFTDTLPLLIFHLERGLYRIWLKLGSSEKWHGSSSIGNQ